MPFVAVDAMWNNTGMATGRLVLKKNCFSVCSDEGLMLKTSAKHHIPQATNIPYQPLLINTGMVIFMKKTTESLDHRNTTKSIPNSNPNQNK